MDQPKGSGAVDIVVTTAGGTSSKGSADEYTQRLVPAWLASPSVRAASARTLLNVFATELASERVNMRQMHELLGDKHLDSMQRYTLAVR
jgi:site-specific recombinase XerD